MSDKFRSPTYFYILKGSEKKNNEEVWIVEPSSTTFKEYKEEPFEDVVPKERQLKTVFKENKQVDNRNPLEESKEIEHHEDKEVVISVRNLTKDYGRNRGIFDISFDVYKGTVFGYCGTNGSGKTTTLRHIMGFLKPDSGSVTIKGLDAWKDADEIKKYIGYLPGEINFPQVENGTEFLKIQAETLGLTDMSKAERIINDLQLDPTANIKRMSKGMKQKTALTATFMHSPEIIILDEPTTGLDPLMRDVFVNLIKEEKARGATIIMSNHMFDELEETCDYVAFIKDGHLVDVVDMYKLRHLPYRDYVIEFEDSKDYESFDTSKLEVLDRNENELSVTFRIQIENTNDLINQFSKLNIKSFTEKKHTLEEFFMEDIGGKK